jgi:D-alanine-D-alanine ligase
LKIGIAFDLAPAVRPSEGPDDRYEEFDKPETIAALADILRGEGHEVALLGDGREFLSRVLADPPDFVWNLAEGEGVGRCREARVPAALEMLGIPCTGSDPLTLALCLDKSMTGRFLAARTSVRVPEGWTLPLDADRYLLESTISPCFERLGGGGTLILKPAFEGSSKGIRTDCLANDAGEAITLFDRLTRAYRQPIIAEEFIAGDEVTVGFVGNGPGLEVLGAMRIVPRRPDGRFVYSIDLKRDWSEHVAYETPARIPEEVELRLLRSAVDAYRALGCRDVARIDFRVRDGIPYFIEANPLPGLAPDWSDLVILARGMGVAYAELVRRILHAALARVGLAEPLTRGAGAIR